MNTVVEVSSLVSSSDLPPREGEGEGERFYLTTAINYTNGERALDNSNTFYVVCSTVEKWRSLYLNT